MLRGGRHNWLVRRMSLARQLLLLQLVVVAVAVVVAGVDRRPRRGRPRDRAAARARAVARRGAGARPARSRAALRGDDPSRVLQPLAERVRRASDLGFVVFMSPAGVRYSHPDPERIGGRFVGTIAPGARGPARSPRPRPARSAPRCARWSPIRDGSRVVGLVSVGVLQEAISDQVSRQLPGLLALAGDRARSSAALLSLLVARRVRRQTRGLDPDELAALYDHHDAVLHAIREGVVVVGDDDRLLLANGEARRLLGLPDDAVGRPIAELVADPTLLAAMRGSAAAARGPARRRRAACSSPASARPSGTAARLATVDHAARPHRARGARARAGDASAAWPTRCARRRTSRPTSCTRSSGSSSSAATTTRSPSPRAGSARRRTRSTSSSSASASRRSPRCCSPRRPRAASAACTSRSTAASDLPAGLLPSEDLVTIVGNLDRQRARRARPGAPAAGSRCGCRRRASAS